VNAAAALTGSNAEAKVRSDRFRVIRLSVFAHVSGMMFDLFFSFLFFSCLSQQQFFFWILDFDAFRFSCSSFAHLTSEW
jgi:hypothetical protein